MSMDCMCHLLDVRVFEPKLVIDPVIAKRINSHPDAGSRGPGVWIDTEIPSPIGLNLDRLADVEARIELLVDQAGKVEETAVKAGFFLLVRKLGFKFFDGIFREMGIVPDVSRDHMDGLIVSLRVDLVVDPRLCQRSEGEPIPTPIVNQSPKGSYVFISRWRFVEPRNVALPTLKLFSVLFMRQDVEDRTGLKLPLDGDPNRIPHLALYEAHIEPFFQEGYDDLAHAFLEVLGHNTALYRPIKTHLIRIPLGIKAGHMEQELHAPRGGLARTVATKDSPRRSFRLMEAQLLGMRLVVEDFLTLPVFDFCLEQVQVCFLILPPQETEFLRT